MGKEERLAALVEGLTSDPAYVDGERRYPGQISEDDSAEIAEALMAEADIGVQARSQQAQSQGIEIACRRGCNACCEEMIMVWEPEAIAVARWLGRPENRTVRDQFLAGYPEWRERVGDVAARLAGCNAAGDRKSHSEIFIEHWRRRIPCAFNRDGDCTIYPIRPIKCRNAHATDTADLCAGDNEAGTPATRLTFAPLAEYIEKSRQLLRAAHHALDRPRGRPSSLCMAVYDRLTSPVNEVAASARKRKPGRNDPCSCGSGKKHKRCCGR